MLKAITLRLDDDLYNQIKFLSNQNKISLNKMATNLIVDNLKGNDLKRLFNDMNKYLESIDKKLEHTSKNISANFKVTKQLFANKGYISNADVKYDRALREILDREYIFND